MSQYESTESPSGKGKWILVGILILAAFTALNIIQDKETLFISAAPEQGVIILGWEKVPFSETRNLWASVYSREGKQLWSRKYKITLEEAEWTEPLVSFENEEWSLQIGPVSLLLDEKGKLLEQSGGEVVLAESTSDEEDIQIEESLKEGFGSTLKLGKLEYVLEESGGKTTLSCSKPSAELWSINLDKHLSFAGEELEVLGLAEDTEGYARVLIQVVGRENPESVALSRSGEVLKYSLTDDTSIFNGLNLSTSKSSENTAGQSSRSGTVYGQAELEIEVGHMNYHLRKGNLIGLDRETMETWEHRLFLPLLDLMEDYF